MIETIYHSTLVYMIIEQEKYGTLSIIMWGVISLLLVALIVNELIKLILLPTPPKYYLRKKYSTCEHLFSFEIKDYEVWWLKRVLRIIFFSSVLFMKVLSPIFFLLFIGTIYVYSLCIIFSILKAFIFHITSIPFYYTLFLVYTILFLLFILIELLGEIILSIMIDNIIQIWLWFL